MIPADHISFNDDGTEAWVVLNGAVAAVNGTTPWHGYDRPCDHPYYNEETGSCVWENVPRGCIDGRHTFTIEVEFVCVDDGHADGYECPADCTGRSFATYRVSVIPGMVLEIQPRNNVTGPQQIVPSGTGKWWLWSDYRMGETIADLPPAAAPGMWAVKLKVEQ
jgi:hypothetical protein